MKRFLLILFVMMLPLQAAWSAVGAYCTHANDAATGHFGHHSHQHAELKVDGEPEPETASGSATDNDCCGLCHCAYLATVLRIGLLDSASSPGIGAQALPPLPITIRPERPNWSVLA